MFRELKMEVEDRFVAARQFFDATGKLEGRHATAAKGLIFVQVYAVYEFTVTRAISASINTIKGHNHKMKDLTPSLLALFLDPELRSLGDVARKLEWDRRLRLFEKALSAEPLSLSSETNPPDDRSHYRYSQLELIFRVFGIARMPVRRRRHGQRIDEVVGHRNSIAHGDETPEDVGRRYTRSEIRKAIRQMRSVCTTLIDVLAGYAADPSRHRR